MLVTGQKHLPRIKAAVDLVRQSKKNSVNCQVTHTNVKFRT
jgi:hypothetical protein